MLDLDMLDCCMYAAFSIVMYVLLFYMSGFGGSPAREADKIDTKINFFMFIGYVHQLTDVHNLCSSVGRGT
jgi:bacteriorhodopsin